MLYVIIIYIYMGHPKPSIAKGLIRPAGKSTRAPALQIAGCYLLMPRSQQKTAAAFGKLPCYFIGKSTISMVIFNRYPLVFGG